MTIKHWASEKKMRPKSQDIRVVELRPLDAMKNYNFLELVGPFSSILDIWCFPMGDNNTESKRYIILFNFWNKLHSSS